MTLCVVSTFSALTKRYLLFRNLIDYQKVQTPCHITFENLIDKLMYQLCYKTTSSSITVLTFRDSSPKMPGHSSGWAAFGCNKRLDPSMLCLSLIYQVICA